MAEDTLHIQGDRDEPEGALRIGTWILLGRAKKGKTEIARLVAELRVEGGSTPRAPIPSRSSGRARRSAPTA